MIYRLNMLNTGTNEVKMAGFYDNEWKLSAGDFIHAD
jgi:hypothetical protein